MCEWVNGKWIKYDEIGGSATYKLQNQKIEKNWGKFYQLSKRYPTYTWYKDKRGYDNFASWVEKIIRQND